MLNAPTVVLNGDTWLELDLGSMLSSHERSRADITVVVRYVPDTARYGAVAIAKDHITGFCEKRISGPGFINAGIYLLLPSLFERLDLPEIFSFDRDVLIHYVRELQLGAFRTDGGFIDIGIPEDYNLAERILVRSRNT